MNSFQRVMVLASCCLLMPHLHAAGDTPPPHFPTSPPQAPPLAPPPLPPVFAETLENGMEVVVVTNEEIPWVSTTWYLLAGSKHDPPGRAGLAAVTAQLLRQGTSRHSSAELSEQLDLYAIKLGGSAGHELTSVSAGGLAEHVDRAIQHLAEVIRTPTFPEKEFRRHVAQVSDGMRVSEAEGNYWADREFRRRIYGAHYLGWFASGTSQSLARLKPGEPAEFHRRYYMPNNSCLVFSGAITPEKAVALARQYFGDWPAGESVDSRTPPIPDRRTTHIYLVNRPNATQSQLRIGQLGFRRNDPRYTPGQVYSQILGGGFSSRLNSKVRVEEGLTYGARGGFKAGREPGWLLCSTFTKTESTAEALRAMLEVIESMAHKPPTAEELSDAQSYLTGRFGLSLETPQDVAGKIFELRFYGLPGDYYTSYLRQINALTAADITRFATETVDPARLTIVVVGQAAQLRDPLTRIAPVTVIEIEGGG